MGLWHSPPAEGDPDVKQIQEDLPQEQEDNAVEPEKKKEALKVILADYNAQYPASGSQSSRGRGKPKRHPTPLS